MTIQILQAIDNNPPKISFLSIFKPSKAKKNYFYIMLGLVFIYTLFKTMGRGQSFFGKFFWNLGIIWVLNIPVILVWAFFTKVIGVAKMRSTDGFGGNIHDYYKKVFIHYGYQVDFEAKGILIDTKN